MTEIKSVERADLLSILELDSEIFYPQEYNFRTIRQMFDLSREYFILAKDGNKLAGYCLGATSGTTGWILTIAVDANFRGQGFGKLLAKESVARFMSDDHVNDIKLTVHPDNVRAKALYTSLGFVELGREEDYYGEGEHRLIMQLLP